MLETAEDVRTPMPPTVSHVDLLRLQRPKDNAKWQLVEVCPILGQKGFKYRLRSLNGRILVSEKTPNGPMLKAMVLSEAKTKPAIRTQVGNQIFLKN